jgi:predicted permease
MQNESSFGIWHLAFGIEHSALNLRSPLPVESLMPHLAQDIRYGVRTLLKTPGFTAVAVLVLAIGIGANSAMFTLVNALLFKPLAGRTGELVGLYSHDTTQPGSYRAFSYPNYLDVREGNDVFDALMAHTFAMVGVPAGDGMKRAFAEVVSSNYFEALGAPLAAGRPFSAAEERPGARVPVAIVGYDRAGLLGQQIKINGLDFTVIGVAPRGFTGTMAIVTPDVWLPLGMFDVVVNDIFKKSGAGLADRASPSLVVAGRLRPGVTIDAATARLETISRRLEEAFPAENRHQRLTISPLSRLGVSTSPSTAGGAGGAAAFLMGLAGVVLLIACLNIANMLLARGTSRRKEIAIRLAVGGSRWRIVRQLLTESLLLALAGAAAGLLLASWTTSALAGSFHDVLPLQIQFDARPDAAVMTVTTLLAIVATIVFGVGPALKLTRADLVTDLKELTSDRTAALLGRRFTARNVLVVGQVALSLMLLSAGGLFARGALKAAAADPGFDYERELLVRFDPSFIQYDERRGRAAVRNAMARIRALPGVDAAGTASSVPFGEEHEGHPVERVAPGAAAPVFATFRIVSGDYFRALGLPMRRGREFSPAEEESPAAPRTAIIDEALARRLFGDRDPIGQSIRLVPRSEEMTSGDGQPLDVIGIAAPIRDDLFDREARPAIYVASGRNYRAGTNVHVRVARTGLEADVLAAIRRELRAMDPRLPVLQATTMRAFHDRSLELWVVSAGGRLFLGFGLLALALAVVGLYGVKSYLIAQRTREIGIRMALGARPSDVMTMVLKEGAALSAVGVGIGLPLAALLGFALSSVLYDVKPLDPIVFLSAPALLALAALAATFVPARRATRITPLTALRAE